MMPYIRVVSDCMQKRTSQLKKTFMSRSPRTGAKEHAIQEKLKIIAEYKKTLAAEKVAKPPVRVTVSSLRMRLLLNKLLPKKTLTVEEFREQVIKRLNEIRIKGKKIEKEQEAKILEAIARRIKEA